MTDPRPSAAPAGWYTDPSGQPGQRWWDGASWTANTQPTPVAQPVQVAQTVPSFAADEPYGGQSSAFSQALNSVRPAGWYPDGTNYGQQRWWDGNQWTAQVTSPYQSAQVSELRAAEGTSPYNWQIWVIVAIYVVLPLAMAGWILTLSVADLLAAGSSDYGIITPGYVALVLFGLFASIATVVLAASDGRELVSRGVVRPFHWAFTLIPSYGPTIYIIGRSVIARRRTGWGIAPIWVHIGSTVGGVVLCIVAFIVVVTGIMNTPSYF